MVRLAPVERTRSVRPQRGALLLLLAGFLLLLAAPLAAQGGRTWYARRITTGDAPLRIEDFWSRGPDLHAELVFGGHPIVTIVHGERYLTLDRLQMSGVSIQRSPKAIRQDANRGRPFGHELEILLADGGEKVGTEKVSGRRCDLYRVTDAKGRREVCVSQDKARLPLLLRVFDRSSGRSVESRYVEWESGIEIPDSFFAPDPRYQLEQFSYEDYLKQAAKGPVGPSPALHADLLHGR